ncbi:unnamed protein product [Dicrocoelium dendriticum]|nr:unnamed protein product [Dicrocoelium dendriticum]
MEVRAKPLEGIPCMEVSPRWLTLTECLKCCLGEWRCVSLTLLILVCLVGALACRLGPNRMLDESRANASELTTLSTALYMVPPDGMHCPDTYVMINTALMVLFYAVYLIECWNSPYCIRAHHVVDPAIAYNWFGFLRRTQPLIQWNITCFHYGGMDKHGTALEPTVVSNPISRNTKTRSGPKWPWPVVKREHSGKQAPNIKTITAIAKEVVDFQTLGGVRDESDYAHQIECFSLVEVSIQVEFWFANDRIRKKFFKLRHDLIRTFDGVDSYLTIDQDVGLKTNEPMQHHFWVTGCSAQLPIYLRQTTFAFAALLLLSFPLRAYICFRTARLNYTVRKVFGPQSTDSVPTHSSRLRYALIRPVTSNARLFPYDTAFPIANEGITLCNSQLSLGSLELENQSKPLQSTQNENAELLPIDMLNDQRSNQLWGADSIENQSFR